MSAKKSPTVVATSKPKAAPSSFEETAHASSRMIIHSVKNGESLWDLSKKYSVTIAMLKKWNGLKGDNLYPRQKIRIYSGIPQATAKKVAMSDPGRRL